MEKVQTNDEEIIYKARWNPIFKSVNNCRLRYRILKGSAGSGKSVNVAQDYIKKLSSPLYEGSNLLVCRKTEETNRDSTFAELQSAVYRIFGKYASNVWRVTLNPLMMECKQTGAQILFRGMYDERQRERIKSITFKRGKLTWVWFEEMTEFLENDVDIIDDRMRGILENPHNYYQLTGTFNPISASHWVKSKFFDVEHPDIFTHHSTYLDNRFIDSAYHRRMMMRKERDPEGYQVYGLGNWGELGGLILTNWQVHDFDINPDNFDGMANGQDFGFNHANALLELGWKDGELYICKELYLFEHTNEEVIKKAQGLFQQDIPMWCDSAEPDRIKEWRQAGFDARPVKKTVLPDKNKANLGHSVKKYINQQIDWLKSRKIHIHPSCVNTKKELEQWKWQKDAKTNLYIDEPVEFMDDAIAGLRYGCEQWRKHTISILDVI